MHKHNKKRKAFFFTLFYPFTHHNVLYDAYILDEVEQLTKHFDSVDIISLSTYHDGQVEVADNVTVHNLRAEITAIDKLLIGTVVGRKFFLDELKSLKIIYQKPLSFRLFKAIAAYAVKANKFYSYIEKMLLKIDFAQEDVWLYSYWNFEVALSISLLKNKYPVKTVVRTHSLDLYFDRMPENYQPFKRFVYLHSDLFAFISQQGMNYFFDVHKIPEKEKKRAILNHIGTRNEFALYKQNDEKIVLLSNAWIQPLKRIDLMVKSLALIDDIEIEWIHVGDDQGSGRLLPLKKLAAEYLSEKRNINYEFVGKKTREELFALYESKKVNLFINLSTTEGTPVSMMEALSFGVSIIGTNVGGVPEIIQDGVNGLLLPAEITEKQVSEKIKEWFKLSAAQKQQLSNNAREIWRSKFNADRNSQELINRLITA